MAKHPDTSKYILLITEYTALSNIALEYNMRNPTNKPDDFFLLWTTLFIELVVLLGNPDFLMYKVMKFYSS